MTIVMGSLVSMLTEILLPALFCYLGSITYLFSSKTAKQSILPIKIYLLALLSSSRFIQ